MENLVFINHVGVPDLQIILNYKLNFKVNWTSILFKSDFKDSGPRTPRLLQVRCH